MLLKLPLTALRYVSEQVRETLPESEKTAGVWLAGFAWSFVLHWLMLVLVTWLWSVTR